MLRRSRKIQLDLRQLNLSAKEIRQAAHVLNYQPFIITDDLQTGVAYSWLYSDDPRVKPPLVFRREQWREEWDKISTANQRLRLMYDDFLDEIAQRYPGGSLFDIGCNNGYFPVGAERRQMRNCAGSDHSARHAKAMTFLNAVLGTNARFITARYNPATGKITQDGFCGRRREVGRFDVVVASAIMCHMPNPLLFLSALGRVAKEAIFFWGQMLDTEVLVASYNAPHPNLSLEYKFPYRFNDNTRISRGLFREAAREMGFREVVFLPTKPHWLFADNPHKGDFVDEIRNNTSPHIAALARR